MSVRVHLLRAGNVGGAKHTRRGRILLQYEPVDMAVVLALCCRERAVHTDLRVERGAHL